MYRYHPSKLIWAGECLIVKIRSGNRRAGYRGLDSMLDLVLSAPFRICTNGARITCVGIIQCTILRWGGQAYYIL